MSVCRETMSVCRICFVLKQARDLRDPSFLLDNLPSLYATGYWDGHRDGRDEERVPSLCKAHEKEVAEITDAMSAAEAEERGG